MTLIDACQLRTYFKVKENCQFCINGFPSFSYCLHDYQFLLKEILINIPRPSTGQLCFYYMYFEYPTLKFYGNALFYIRIRIIIVNSLISKELRTFQFSDAGRIVTDNHFEQVKDSKKTSKYVEELIHTSINIGFGGGGTWDSSPQIHYPRKIHLNCDLFRGGG